MSHKEIIARMLSYLVGPDKIRMIRGPFAS